MSNNSKIALITGGSRGLGRDMAIRLAESGIDIIITYNNQKEEADKVVEDIKCIGRNAFAFQLDIRISKSFDTFFQHVAETLESALGNSKIDFLINNAGTALYTAFIDTTEDQVDEIFNVHYKGVYFLTQKALKHMNDGGSIINISSGLARYCLSPSSAYGSMKGAIDVLSRYLAKELGPRRISVNSLAPGAIATDFGGGRVRDNKDISDNIANMTALGRVGQADDIGGIVAFLCSDAAKWINGQRIEATGGVYL